MNHASRVNCSLPLRAKNPSSGEAGHRALYAFFGGNIYRWCIARLTRVNLLSPRRGNAAVRARLVTTWLPSKWRRLRVRVDRLESGSAVAGSPPAGATTISAPCGIFHYIDDRLHKTTPVHADPLCFPSAAPPHSLLSLLGVFFPPLPPDQDKPSCGCVWGLLFFFFFLERQLLRRIIAGAKKSFHLFHRRLVSACPRYILISADPLCALFMQN